MHVIDSSKRVSPLLVVLSCSMPALFGCALGPGEPFARLSASFQTAYEIPADRSPTPPDGWARLNTDTWAQVTALTLDPHHVVFQGTGRSASASSSETAGSFDPANPPEGYSLCHGGHCHREDGALIPYAEISASLGESGASGLELELEVPSLDVLAGESAAVDCEGEPCSLGEGTLTAAVVELGLVRLEAEVRDALNPPRFPGTVLFRFSITDEEAFAPASIPLSIPIGAGESVDLDVALRFAVGPSLLDDLDFTALVRNADGVIALSETENVEATQLVWNRLRAAVDATATPH